MGIALFGSALAHWAVGQTETDRAATERILAELAPPVVDGGPAPEVDGGLATEATKLTAAPAGSARKALERATGARLAGYVRQGELMEGLAREWAETARDLVRAAKSESEAADLQTRAAQAAVRAERQRALLEEAIARRGRAEVELERVTGDGGAKAAPSASAPPPRTKPAASGSPAAPAPKEAQ
jgi:hypothetical protein